MTVCNNWKAVCHTMKLWTVESCKTCSFLLTQYHCSIYHFHLFGSRCCSGCLVLFSLGGFLLDWPFALLVLKTCTGMFSRQRCYCIRHYALWFLQFPCCAWIPSKAQATSFAVGNTPARSIERLDLWKFDLGDVLHTKSTAVLRSKRHCWLICMQTHAYYILSPR